MVIQKVHQGIEPLPFQINDIEILINIGRVFCSGQGVLEGW
jgi:hypothetical protein